jgi:hypothetical protein
MGWGPIMATLILPVRSDFKAYRFQVDLEGVIYTLDFGYNERSERWCFSIYAQDGETLLLGDIPILINIPLHDQYVTDDLPPGRFIAMDETGQNREATSENFGTEIKLFYQESA